jgi:hypothetical protein
MLPGKNLEMIETVAAGLQPLLDQVVFIGGASACLHIQDQAAQLIRPTDDVDCVMAVASRIGYSRVEKQLRSLGFAHVMEPGHPICRWRYHGVLVDVMPDDPAILGFSNQWYTEGITRAKPVKLPSGLTVLCFTLPYFLASKIEAFESRGADYRTSHDIEDVIIVLDGQLDFTEIEEAPTTVAAYLRAKFHQALANRDFAECIHGHLPPDPSNTIRAQRILAFLQQFCSPALM